MISIRPLVPLLAAAGILLAGNGLLGTIVALRAEAEGFSVQTIGLMGTAYFVGFLLGTWQVMRWISSVGHIRVFASLAALAACSTLILAMVVDPWAWIFLRLVAGFCLAGLFTVVESWLNTTAENSERGRLLSVYRIVDLLAVTGAQLVIPVMGISGFEPFSIMAIVLCLSLVPIALSTRSQPVAVDNQVKFDLLQVWRISPAATIGIFAIGLTTSTFRMMGPIYATGVGLELTGAAVFMAIGIIGGATLQYPLGWLSDRYDRRWILVGATVAASVAGFALSQAPTDRIEVTFAAIFAFGAFALPLYSLAVAHANDHARPGQYALLSAGLIFVYSLGATVGPVGASFVIDAFGIRALFAYVSAIHLLLAIWTMLRMLRRSSVPIQDRVRYTPLMRTSPAIFRLAKRRLGKADQ